MRAARLVLMLLGVGAGLWGLWMMRDFRWAQVLSLALFLVAGVIVHDAVLAPLTVGVGATVGRVVPAGYRAPVVVAGLVWATVTVAVANVLSGRGGKPDNDTILDRPYLVWWLSLTLVLVAAAVLVGRRRARMG